MEYEKREQTKSSAQSSVSTPGSIVEAFSKLEEQERRKK